VKKILFALSAIAILGMACGTPPSANGDGPEIGAPDFYPPRVLQHKNTALGGDIPFWVTMEEVDIEAMDEYEGTYAFKFDSGPAENLKGAEYWVDNFDARNNIAAQIRTRVQQKFAGAAVGDMDMLETYMENVSKSLAEAEYSGLRRRGTFWVEQRSFKDDGSKDVDRFIYYVFFTIPQENLDQKVEEALAGADAEAPATEEERTARARVREAFSGGL
jgi:hypothetical protein